MERPCIPFFTDHNVADSVGKVIIQHGHALIRLRDVMPRDSKDPLVALACAQAGQVLVSHDNDFREIARRLQVTQREYRTQLHRIDLRCLEPAAAGRMTEAMALVESEWTLAIAQDRSMVIEIRDHSIRLMR